MENIEFTEQKKIRLWRIMIPEYLFNGNLGIWWVYLLLYIRSFLLWQFIHLSSPLFPITGKIIFLLLNLHLCWWICSLPNSKIQSKQGWFGTYLRWLFFGEYVCLMFTKLLVQLDILDLARLELLPFYIYCDFLYINDFFQFIVANSCFAFTFFSHLKWYVSE